VASGCHLSHRWSMPKPDENLKNSKKKRPYCVEIAGSIPDGAIGIFHWNNPSVRTMALGLTQPLTEMSTKKISWGYKDGLWLGLTTSHLHMPIILKSGTFNLLEPSRSVQVCNGISVPLPLPLPVRICRRCKPSAWISSIYYVGHPRLTGKRQSCTESTFGGKRFLIS